MSAFLWYGDVGVWASNSERDAFLDWFAEHRCTCGDARWEYCKSGAQRWMGRCIDLDELLTSGERLGVTDEEYRRAADEYGPHVAQLLRVVDKITRGEGVIRIDSHEAMSWRKP